MLSLCSAGNWTQNFSHARQVLTLPSSGWDVGFHFCISGIFFQPEWYHAMCIASCCGLCLLTTSLQVVSVMMFRTLTHLSKPQDGAPWLAQVRVYLAISLRWTFWLLPLLHFLCFSVDTVPAQRLPCYPASLGQWKWEIATGHFSFHILAKMGAPWTVAVKTYLPRCPWQ